MFVALKKILPKTLKKIGAHDVLNSIDVKNIWRGLISGIYGEEAIKSVKIINLKNGILTIQCLNSVWAAELKLKSDFLISEINKKIRQKKVLNLKVIY